MGNVLGVFAKNPQPGQVKTRLAAATSSRFAAQVAEAMLLDTLDRLAAMEADRWLAYAPADADVAMAGFAAGRYRLTPQGEGDLGERLARFFQRRLGDGERIVVVGADSPTLPLDLITQAYCALNAADVVLGPATDGGYCLVGCTRRLPPIFHDMEWGGPTVLCETLARLKDRRVSVLPAWHDVDTLEDWRLLRDHLAEMRGRGHDPGVPRTEGLLKVEVW